MIITNTQKQQDEQRESCGKAPLGDLFCLDLSGRSEEQEKHHPTQHHGQAVPVAKGIAAG